MLKTFIFESKGKTQIIVHEYYDYLKSEVKKLNLKKEEEEKWFESVFKETLKFQEKNMNKIIIPALNALESTWNGSNVFIIPNIQTDYQYGGEKFETSPMNDSYVYVTKQSTISENSNEPHFTLFVSDTNILVEDVLDAGDRDFFRDPEVETDYFNLVSFLKNGHRQRNKIISVYTARPKKDREQLQNLVNKNLFPKNIFVTTSLEEAEGYAYDLATTEKRDIWYLKIRAKYLIQTLDVNGIKNYQTFNSTEKFVPIEYGTIY